MSKVLSTLVFLGSASRLTTVSVGRSRHGSPSTDLLFWDFLDPATLFFRVTAAGRGGGGVRECDDEDELDSRFIPFS
jgi:hypothetical protein